MSGVLTFGSWLRQRRKELSITQEALAERLGISWIMLRKLETGERHPSGQIALLMAEHLRVPLDERQAFVAFARTGVPVVGPASQTTPWRKAFFQQTNLPAPLTSIISREQEEAAVLTHLRSPRTRLLTLTGAPGIGKTRLGLQVASELLAFFEDGVFFVDLAPVMDPGMVVPAIARTLSLVETPDRPLNSLLLDFLREKRLLLLLDNFEQILDASTEVVSLLEACPWLKVMITSRAALQVRGERRFVVPPLALPDLHHPPDLAVLAGIPSVALFVERAQLVAPGFTLTVANAHDVAAVCVGLEGLPLAIEVAASRADQISLPEMRSALSSRLKLLRTETRDLPARHRTVRGAIKWSYDLLDHNSQALFRMLGVFVGGFTLEAVESMAQVSKLAGKSTSAHKSARAILDALMSLVNGNLVRRDSMSRGSETSEDNDRAGLRFRMWEAAREFALEELGAKGELASVERLHADYYATLAQEAELQLVGAEQVRWLERLEQEQDNFRAALRWCVEATERGNYDTENITREKASTPNPLETGLRTAGALGRFWYIRGYYSEGRKQIEELLPLAERFDCSLEARAKALNSLGNLADMQGDYAEAHAALELAIALLREVGDWKGITASLNSLGNVAANQADYASATAYYEESLKMRRDLGDKWGIAVSLNNIGLLAQEQGNYLAAEPLFEESLDLFRQIQDTEGIAHALSNLGNVAAQKGDYKRLRMLREESLRLSREVGGKDVIAHALLDLGGVALLEGDLDLARKLSSESLAIRRDIGDKWGSAFSLNHLAKIAYLRRDHAAAYRLHKESLSIQRELGTRRGVTWGLAGLAAVALDAGDARRAALLLAAASTIWELTGDMSDAESHVLVERCTAEAKDRLAEASFREAWEEGRDMTVEEAITYALETPPYLTTEAQH